MPLELLQLAPPFLLALYLTIFVHELGHALMGSRVGYLVSACGMGLGRPWGRIRLGRTVLYACWQRPFQGLTFSLPTRSVTRRREEVALLAGGLMAHIVVIALCLVAHPYAAGGTAPRTWLDILLWVNVAYLGIGLIPVRFRVGGAVIESDMLRILHLMRNRRRGSPAPLGVKRDNYRQCVEHLAAIGDPIGEASYRTELAMLELDCGGIDAADELLRQPPPDDSPAYLRARHRLACAWRASERGDDPSPHLRAAEQAFDHDPAGRRHVELLRLELAIDALEEVRSDDCDAPGAGPAPDAVDHAVTAIDRWLASAEHPRWATDAARRLRARAWLAADDIENATADLDSIGADDWLRWLADGRAHQLAGRDAEALACYQRILSGLRRELRGIDDRDARRQMLARQARLLTYLDALGDDAAAALEDIAQPPRDPASGRIARASEDDRLDSHLAVLGVWFTGAAALIDIALTIAIHTQLGLSPLLMHRLATIAGSAAVAGFGSALLAFTTRDRTRLAWIALAVAPPAALQALALLRHITMAAAGAG